MSQGSLLPDATEPILEFKDEFRFLSNFWSSPIAPVGPWWDPHVCAVFPTVEHAYQVAKVEPATPNAVPHMHRILWRQDDPERDVWTKPGDAKHWGGAAQFRNYDVTLRRGWDNGVKVMVMLACLRAKFAPVSVSTNAPQVPEAPAERPTPDLSLMLVATSPRVLVEGNHWGDDYWGVLKDGRGAGKNMLGRLLMLVRAELLVAYASGVRVEELSPYAA